MPLPRSSPRRALHLRRFSPTSSWRLETRPQASQKPDIRPAGAAPPNMMYPDPMETKARRRPIPVRIGPVTVGGAPPIAVQSTTTTGTAEVEATPAHVAALARAGSELVRITVDRAESAAAVPRIKERLDRLGVDAPLIGDFHYN